MAATDDQLPTRRKTDSGDDSGDGTLRILAVDDDESYLRYLSWILTKAGFEVELARDGVSAIERVHLGSRIDMMVVDLTMPGIDGIETVRRIHTESRFRGLYAILLTAKDGTDVKLRAFDGGLDDFITKTSSESEIMTRIRSAARRLQLERELYVENEALQALALTDELTGIANRRALLKTADEIMKAGRMLTVVLFDLDHFKEVNDTHGHLTGDRILADVAASFKTNTRYCDIIGRYGGDEFVLLLPDTAIEESQQMAERLLASIRELRWPIGGTVVSIDAQFGIASSATSGATLNAVFGACDDALYRAKRLNAPAEEHPESR